MTSGKRDKNWKQWYALVCYTAANFKFHRLIFSLSMFICLCFCKTSKIFELFFHRWHFLWKKKKFSVTHFLLKAFSVFDLMQRNIWKEIWRKYLENQISTNFYIHNRWISCLWIGVTNTNRWTSSPSKK